MMADIEYTQWPEHSLEHLGLCPICGNPQRKILISGLVDDTFRAAPGSWTLWQCGQCGNAYLDPRPDIQSIGEAYAAYYTHERNKGMITRKKGLSALKEALGNGYRNQRFGSNLRPALPIGAIIAKLLPWSTGRTDWDYRFIKRGADKGRRVLDIGCGNGAWLELARQAGWSVFGIEPDPVSSGIARGRGIDVRTDLSGFQGGGQKFALITMNHVIEHLHDPVSSIQTCFELLEPGGELYLETPNLHSIGLERYGRHWRGLESPRHLVLFHVRGLKDLLKASGFHQIRLRPQFHVWRDLSLASERMSRGALPSDESVKVRSVRYRFRDSVRARLDPTKSEFITLSCRRPC